MSYTQRILRAMLAGLIIFVVPIASNSGTWPDPSNYTSTGPAEINLGEIYDVYPHPGRIYNNLYAEITGYMSVNSSKAALKKLFSEAQNGNAEAQALLANLYAKPAGIKGVISPNRRKAAQWMHKAVQGMRKAAERGDSNAQYILGVYYESGQGVPGSYAEAAKWYRKAAQQGDRQAYYRMGLLYEGGNGVAQDYAQAVYWYRKAMQKGLDFDTANRLSVLYEYGLGVPQDTVLALALYLIQDCNKLPNEDGYGQAQPFRHIKEMTAKQIEDAQSLCHKMGSMHLFDVLEQYQTKIQGSTDNKSQ